MFAAAASVSKRAARRASIDKIASTHPYRGEETSHPACGPPLRADVHVLLDCDLLAIDRDGLQVVAGHSIRESSNAEVYERALRP